MTSIQRASCELHVDQAQAISSRIDLTTSVRPSPLPASWHRLSRPQLRQATLSPKATALSTPSIRPFLRSPRHQIKAFGAYSHAHRVNHNVRRGAV